MSKRVRATLVIISTIAFNIGLFAMIWQIWTTGSSIEHTIAAPLLSVTGIGFMAMSLYDIPNVKFQLMSLGFGVLMHVIYFSSIMYFR